MNGPLIEPSMYRMKGLYKHEVIIKYLKKFGYSCLSKKI